MPDRMDDTEDALEKNSSFSIMKPQWGRFRKKILFPATQSIFLRDI